MLGATRPPDCVNIRYTNTMATSDFLGRLQKIGILRESRHAAQRRRNGVTAQRGQALAQRGLAQLGQAFNLGSVRVSW